MSAFSLPWRRSLARTCTLAWLESLTIRRDPVLLAMVLLIPTVQVALFGYAIRPLGGQVPVIVARAQAGPDLPAALEETGALRVVGDGFSEADALAQVRTGAALIAIIFSPPSEGESGGADADKSVARVFVNDSDPVRVEPALSALEARYWRQVAQGGEDEVHVERLYNPGRRNDWIMTPGLSGVVVMISMLMLGALCLVRERERGTWEALLSTPVSAGEAIVGKALPYLVLGCLQAVVVIGCCRFLFGLPLRGDLPAFGLFLVVYTFTHLLMGLTLSAAARNGLQAVQGAVLIYLPSTLLSGFLFPFANLPWWAQRIGTLLPLTQYVEVARGVTLRGVSAGFVLARTAPVAALAALWLAGAILAFRRRL